MDPVLARIEAWQRAGLIDPPTAERLRAAEAANTAARADIATAPGRQVPRAGVAASDVVGPAPTVVEMFGFLGGGFLLAAWTAFVSRLNGDGSNLVVTAVGLLVAAAVLAGVGLRLRTGDARRRRAAGVAFLGAIAYSTGAAAGFLSSLGVSGAGEGVVLAGIATAVAIVVRFVHAGLLTQFGLLAAITTLGGLTLAWLREMVAPTQFNDKGEPIGAVPDPILMIAVGAAVWLIVALAIGLLGLREDRAGRDSADVPGAPARRATLTRMWAGLVAVGGLASALSTSDLLASGEFGRVVTPWIMDAILLALAAILVERAFRRQSGAFLLAAGLALVIALTDLNFTYLSSSPELGLLVEGGLLLAVGFGADRLRRRLPGGLTGGSADELPDAGGADADPATA